MSDEKERLLNIQIIASIVFIVTTITSIILIYNEKLDLENKETLFSKKATQKISLCNRILIFILVFIFLYANYENKKIAETEHNDTKYLNLDIIASLFSLVSAGIAIYIVLNNPDINSVSDVENPII